MNYRYRYRWEVEYVDGSKLDQEDGEKMRSLKEVDFSRAKYLRLTPRLTGYPTVQVMARVEDGERLIAFWKVEINGITGEEAEVWQVVGIQKTVEGKNFKNFTLFGVDGRVLIQSVQDPQVPYGPRHTAQPLWCTCRLEGTCLGCRIERDVAQVHGPDGTNHLIAHLRNRIISCGD